MPSIDEERAGAGDASQIKRAQTNVRLSNTGRRLLAELQEHFGLSRTGVLELLLREKSRQVAAEPKLLPRPFNLAAIPVVDEMDEEPTLAVIRDVAQGP